MGWLLGPLLLRQARTKKRKRHDISSTTTGALCADLREKANPTAAPDLHTGANSSSEWRGSFLGPGFRGSCGCDGISAKVFQSSPVIS